MKPENKLKRWRQEATREIAEEISRNIGYHHPYEHLLEMMLIEERMRYKAKNEELKNALQGKTPSS